MLGGWIPEEGDICPCDPVGVWAMPMGDPPEPGGGEELPPPPPRAPPIIPPAPPGPVFISFLYLERRFWNQIFTCNEKKERKTWVLVRCKGISIRSEIKE